MNPEPTQTDLQKLLRRVAQLRALANSTGSQHEAETAAAAADEIIAKHRLTEAAIEDSAAPSETAEEHDPLDTFEGNADTWRTSLANGLAKHYGCYVYHDMTKRCLPLFGRRSDVEIVRYMYAWLTTEIARLSLRESGRSAKNAFRHGAVSGFRAAMAESKKKAEAEHARGSGAHASGSAALVLRTRLEESAALARKVAGGLKASTPGRIYDARAYERGQARGRDRNARERREYEAARKERLARKKGRK